MSKIKEEKKKKKGHISKVSGYSKTRAKTTAKAGKQKAKKQPKKRLMRPMIIFDDRRKDGFSFELVDEDADTIYASKKWFKTEDAAIKAAKVALVKGFLIGVNKVNPLPETCAVCGLEYDDMKTGLTFADVRRDMWRTEEDPSQWKYKRRRGVLGAWHGAKQMLWRDHLDTCEAAAAEKKKKSKKLTKKEVEKLKKGLEKELKKKKFDDDETPF